jgi:Tfp pilus assembly PilM family ATPase
MSVGLFKLGRMQPPVRRVLALDAGSRCLKLLLAQSDFGRLHLLKEELIDLQAEGLVSAEEVKSHLQSTLQALGRPPLAIVLPQHLSTSQVVDLPLAPEREVAKLIEDETLKLSGVSESRIVYDFVRTESPVKNRQQFWVTLCQEGEIRERLLRLGVEQEDICEVTTTANALIAAYRAAKPLSSRAILVHLGAQATVVVVLLAGQGAFAASFEMGGDFFTRALARLGNCPEPAAADRKHSHDLFQGPEADPKFCTVVDGWVAELQRQLHDWFEHNPALAPDFSSFEWVASGGGFHQPGLVEYIKARAGISLQPWPKGGPGETAAPAKGFEVAFGAALQALGYSAQPVSLLPDDYRANWRKRLWRQRLDFASFALLLLCAVILAIGTWHKASLLLREQALLRQVQVSQQTLDANTALTAELVDEYESFRPLFVRQQNTLDTLKTLALLQQVRSNRSFWYILFADQQSYFNQPLGPAPTNKPLRATFTAPAPDRPRLLAPDLAASLSAATNLSPAKPGFIAELCVPEDLENSRRLLSQLVNELKRQPLFAKVDLLSEDLRRNLADPKVVLPDHRSVLALDFAETAFQPAASPRATPLIGPPRPPSKRGPRPPRPAPDNGEPEGNP